MLSKYIVSMHYEVIFSPEILQIPPLGSVNEHPSRMPAGRGMTPSFWGMLIGDTHNWITLHHVRTLSPVPEARSSARSREAYAFLAGHNKKVWEAKAAEGR